MEELEKFLDGRSVSIVEGSFYWFCDRDYSTEGPFSEDDKFKFLTLSCQAYRESLVSTD